MSKKPRAGSWKGAFYLRNKQTDKYGNKYKTTPTWRNIHSGVVVDKFGNFKGFEENFRHRYGTDIRRGKKPKTFVRPNFAGAIKPRRAHVRNLR